MTALPDVLRRIKTGAERRLGVRVTRTPPPGKPHFYPELAGLRPWSPDDVVFDVGANDGRTVLRLQEHLPRPRIYAFEPVAATFATLTDRTAQFGNVRCRQLALGAEPGRATMYLHAEDVMNSLSPDWDSPTGTETVQLSTVDRVMQEEGVEFVHFLKIDTEGYELEVLQGAREALEQARIGILQAEVGFGQARRGGATLEDVRRHLAPTGYQLYGIYNQTRSRAHKNDVRTASPGPDPAMQDPAVQDPSTCNPKVLAYCDAVFVSTRPPGSAAAQ